MRIDHREPGEEGRTRIALVPETVDDLWHISHVLEPGDRVGGETTRRIRRDDDRTRDTGGEREPMSVTLVVGGDDVEFARFANRLRVGGEIVSCSREDQLGRHHTLNVEVRDRIEVEKRWKPDQLDRIEDAEDSAERPDVAVATVEEGAAHVHLVAEYGTEEYGSFTAPTGKGEYARPRTELFDDLGAALARLEVDAVVLAGPGFTKEDALDHIEAEHPEVAERVTVVDTSSVGDRGVHEVLKRGAVDEIRDETRISREAELIDELTRRIATEEPATYGAESVVEAAEFGAVETLMLVDERLRRERADGEWEADPNELVESVEQKGGEVVVFSSEFDPGRQLSRLGGVAAVLRYRI